ncbi:MAG: phospholipase D-like domain-containing protein, partial [Elusimicrobiales bacterium]|nr:phospholipase D-like domain-containing protein [Elusimicrobiales bacterium]
TYLPRYAFSPRGGTEAAIIKAIGAAGSEIKIAMFTLTSEPIMSALVRASARGVNVKLLHNAGSSFPFFQDALKSRFDLRFSKGRTERGQMHNKFAVLDGRLLINGAFNWSATAEDKNAENTVLIMEPYYVQVYAGEFDRLFAAAKTP